jgi:hypothetical protein
MLSREIGNRHNSLNLKRRRRLENNNNEKKRWGRRLGSTIGAVILITVFFYICLFKGADLSWAETYTKYIAFFLGVLVSGLTITDVVLKK